jgi:hypothetical protein
MALTGFQGSFLFLHTQVPLCVGSAGKSADCFARMRKTGAKAIKSCGQAMISELLTRVEPEF